MLDGSIARPHEKERESCEDEDVPVGSDYASDTRPHSDVSRVQSKSESDIKAHEEEEKRRIRLRALGLGLVTSQYLNSTDPEHIVHVKIPQSSTSEVVIDLTADMSAVGSTDKGTAATTDSGTAATTESGTATTTDNGASTTDAGAPAVTEVLSANMPIDPRCAGSGGMMDTQEETPERTTVMQVRREVTPERRKRSRDAAHYASGKMMKRDSFGSVDTHTEKSAHPSDGNLQSAGFLQKSAAASAQSLSAKISEDCHPFSRLVTKTYSSYHEHTHAPTQRRLHPYSSSHALKPPHSSTHSHACSRSQELLSMRRATDPQQNIPKRSGGEHMSSMTARAQGPRCQGATRSNALEHRMAEPIGALAGNRCDRNAGCSHECVPSQKHRQDDSSHEHLSSQEDFCWQEDNKKWLDSECPSLCLTRYINWYTCSHSLHAKRST